MKDQIFLYGGMSGVILFGGITVLLFWKLDILHSCKVIFRLGYRPLIKLNNTQTNRVLQIRDGKTTLQLQVDKETQPLTQENTVLLESSNFVIFDEGYLCEGERIIL